MNSPPHRGEVVRAQHERVNTDAYVHAHVVPRYDWEPAERIPGPIWLYPPQMWTDPQYQFDEAKHGTLKNQIAAALQALL